MESLMGYGSGSDESQRLIPVEPEAAAQAAAGQALPFPSDSGSDDSYFGNSGSESDDSAVQRRRAAEARLRDFGEEAVNCGAAGAPGEAGRDGSGGARPLLPAAGEALTRITGRGPAFLNPEATRPVAQSIHRHRRPPPKPAEEAVVPKGRKKRGPSDDWDIASMAPKAKGEEPPQARGVISAAAVRTRGGDDAAGPVTAAQVALMGGQWKPTADAGDDSGGEGAPTAPGAARPPGTALAKRKALAKPMPVSDFLDRGIGGAALPRSRGDRKDKEKDKRGKGQSTASHWKSEAEMVLRQQYDS